MPPQPPSWSTARKFGIVIDAGSSGSRVQVRPSPARLDAGEINGVLAFPPHRTAQVYSWLDPQVETQRRKANKESLDVLNRVEKGVQQGEGWQLKVEPGISSFADTPGGLTTYLRPLLSFASSLIPPSQHSTTPIYLLATAGMRLLPPSAQSAILREACSVLSSSTSFLLSDDCLKHNVRIISGEEEGLFGWIAVNYLMDGFDRHVKEGGEVEDAGSTYGFLDMGGASTQIAFEPNETEREKHADNLYGVRLGLLSGKVVQHPVFVTTWLGFGTNKARERYIDQEITSYESAHSIPTTPTILPDPCLPTNLMLSTPLHPLYTLRGTGDFPSCVLRTGPLLNKSVQCLDSPCLFNGVHVPSIDFNVNRFIGISEYWYSTMDVWGTQEGAEAGVYDFVEFEKNAIKYCGRDWSGILKELKEGGGGDGAWKENIELERLELQCFKAAWIINILHEGIGIPRIVDASEGGEGDGERAAEIGVEKAVMKGLLDDKGRVKKPHFQSMQSVGDVAVSWTLGKMVLEVSGGALSEEPGVDPPSSSKGAKAGAGTIPSTRIQDLNSHAHESIGHTPIWSGGLRNSISALAEGTDDFLPFLFLLPFVGAFVWYLFFRRSSTSRPRSRFFSLVDVSDPDDPPPTSSAPSSPPRLRPPKSSRIPFGKLLNPLRFTTLRTLSAFRWLTRSYSSPLLPTTSSSSSSTSSRPLLPTSSSTSDIPLRPRPLRSSTSTPFLRNTPLSLTPLPTTSTSSTTTTTTHWNDAPDFLLLPERRSASASTSVSSSVLSPAPTSITTSRPSTPHSGSFGEQGPGVGLMRRMTGEMNGVVTPPNGKKGVD